MSHAPKGKKGSDVVKVGFYQIIKTIGQGHSAIVKLANHTITKTNVAIKIIDKRQKDSNLEKIYREIKILKALKHPNIIKLYQVMDSENFLYIVSEYAHNGEIFDYISNHGKFPEKEAKLKFAQILNAVEYCHNLGIVHRDLKAENLLLDENFNVKLADFGFGNFYSKDNVLSTWCGSPPYAAPEIFEGKTYCGPEVDIWSLGVILYVLVVGMLPFDGENLRAIRDKVVTGRFRIPFFMSIECERVLRRILVVDPKRRYTIQQIKQHQWMKEAVVAVSDKNLEDSFSEQLVVTGRGMAALCHKVVLQRMESSNINKEKVIESLEKQAYDNFTAIYEILMKQVAHKVMKQTLPEKLSASGFRRPSVISEQAMVAMQHPQQHQPGTSTQQSVTSPLSPTEAKTPGLAETRKAPFSQTTDGVQLNEVAGPICQMQQIISTIAESSDETHGLSGADAATATGLGMVGGGVLIMPSSPLRPKLTRSSRLMLSPGNCWAKLPGSKVMLPNQLAGNSIDEGVEIESDEVLIVSRISATQPTETSIISATQPTETASSASLTPPYFQASCQPSISIDSNIEIDAAGSNLSLSSPASWSVNSTSSNLPDFMSGTQSTLQSMAAGESNEQSQFSHIQVPEDLLNFQMGRRASDGLAIKPDIAETQQFLKNRVSGVAELRKELVRLQNETMDSGQASQLPQHSLVQVMVSSGGHKSRAILKDQRSLEEALAIKSSQGIKYTSNLAPNFCWVMQKRNPPYSRQSHLQSPMESIQGGLRTDYSCLGTAHRPISPLRGGPKRQVGPMRSVPLHHQLHSNYAMVSGHQFFAEHLASASNSPTRGGKIFSLSPVCLASSSSPGDVNHISSSPYSPVATMSSLGVPQNYVPVCHSQGNLVQNVLFGSPTRHRLEMPTSSSASSPLHQSTTCTIADPIQCSYHHSVGVQQKQDCLEPHFQQELPPLDRIEGDSFTCNPDLEDLEKRPLVRRMIFSLVQHQQVCGSEEEMVTSPVIPRLDELPDANH